MKAAMISLGSISSQWTAKAMQKYFEEVDELDIKGLEVSLGGRNPEIMYEGKPLKNYDCIYAKGSFRYANLLRSIAMILKDKCYMPISSEAFTEGHDKLLTHIRLQGARIPMPTTYIASTAEAAKKVLKKIPFPIVMKFPSGTHGKGVMLADSHESASSMIDALALLKQPFILQEYIETDGTDTRAFVIGDKVAAAMKRKAVRGEKRANIHAGGKGIPTMLDAKAKKIAVETAKAMGCAICAIDILESARGPMVIEINLSPGIQGLTKATNIDVADKIAEFLFEQTKNKFEGEKKENGKKIVTEALSEQEIVTKVDFRGERILLPAIVTKLSKLEEGQEVTIKSKKGRIEIEE